MGHILRSEQKIISTFVHFLGIMLIFETKDTFEIDRTGSDNTLMMDWLAKSMDVMLAMEVLTSI